MLVNETVLPSTGVSTSRANRTEAPVRSTISNALSKVQASHSRTSGLRVSNASGRFQQERSGSLSGKHGVPYRRLTPEKRVPSLRSDQTRTPIGPKLSHRVPSQYPAAYVPAQASVSGVESTQPSCMTRFSGQMKERSRPAANIKHRLRGHHQRQVETEISSARTKRVIQGGEACVGEQSIDHVCTNPKNKPWVPSSGRVPPNRRLKIVPTH